LVKINLLASNFVLLIIEDKKSLKEFFVGKSMDVSKCFSEKVVLFGFRIGTNSPRNRRKIFKKHFFWSFVPVQKSNFWTLKIYEKFSSSIWYLVLSSKKKLR
jgi:hypothetical protein